MKIILTGATGFVGGEALKHAVAHPAISEVVVLTRRELTADQGASPKVKSIVLSDFESYPDTLLAQLAGAEACIWAIGGKATDFADVATARRVQRDYSAAFARACAETLAPDAPGKRFRFVFCSGAMAERDGTQRLAFMSDTRMIKGEAESALVKVAEGAEGFDVVVMRPGGILRGGFMVTLMPGMMVDVADVSAVLVAAAVRDEAVKIKEGEREATLENGEIRAAARALKAKS